MATATTQATTPVTGERPGVKREDFWEWHGQGYFVRCEPHDEVNSIDPRFMACKTCGHSWRMPSLARPQWDTYEDKAAYSHDAMAYRDAENTACDGTIPNRVCVTCAGRARRTGRQPTELPFHHLNVCHGCGAFVCFPHTYWHGEDNHATLCRTCRMAAAKDGRLPKGETVYGEEKRI